jgi:hypothetical protein
MLAGSFAGFDISLPNPFEFITGILKKCFLLIIIVLVLAVVGFIMMYLKPA